MKRYFLGIVAGLLFLIHPVYSQDMTLNIVFIPKSGDQVFWKFMRDGVDKGIREIGNIALTWRGPAYNDDTESQIRIVEFYSHPGIDAIIIAPTDRTRLVEPVRKAAAQGIKVIVVDSALDGNQHQSSVTTDNYSGGKLAAKHLAGLLDGHGKVLIFRTLAGSASTEDRANGFVDYLKANAPKIAIVADEYGGGSRGKALHSATRLLEKGLRIDGIFAVNESSSDGMLRALRNAGLAGKTKFVGFDSTDFLLDALEKNEIDGLVVQDPRQMGYLGIKAAVAAINNAASKTRVIYTGTTMVTRDNYKNPEIQTLLIP